MTRRFSALALGFGLLLTACGGSSSETPWPEEPMGASKAPDDNPAPGTSPVDEPEPQPAQAAGTPTPEAP